MKKSDQPNTCNTNAFISEVTADNSATTVWELIVEGLVYRAERITWEDFL